ncbi:MAG: anthranilate synthase component I family protein [Microbacteriaceae bacterium]
MHPGLPTVVLDGWVEPAAVAAALFDGGPPGTGIDGAMIDGAGIGGERIDGRRAFWLDDASGEAAGRGRSWVGAGAETIGSLAGLRAALAAAERPVTPGPTAPAQAAPGAAAWVGWIGYEARAETMAEPIRHPERFPRVALMRVAWALEFDHAARRVTAHGPAPDIRALPPAPRPADAAAREAHWADAAEDYLAAIEACRRHIRDGDAYQLCLTTEARVEGPVDALAAHLRLRAATPSHHAGLLRVDGVSLVSASPERFLRLGGGRVATSPIKGTRPRGTSPATDAALAAALAASPKERAENLMIVDLMRNDLSRIAELGSVRVASLLAVESHPAVHQLVSTVEARLRPGVGPVEALEATFPAGSMTGAPKRSATRILDRLEARARGVYAGAFGWIDSTGAADLAMVIRSIVADAAGAVVGTGGGITAGSVPEEELAEARLKAAAPLAALGAR